MAISGAERVRARTAARLVAASAVALLTASACSSETDATAPPTTAVAGGSSTGGGASGGTSAGGSTTISTGGTGGGGGEGPVEPVAEPPGLIADFELYEPPLDAIHIDPTNEGDVTEDGSLAHPFDSFADVTWADGIVVAVKRGTTLESDVVEIRASNVIIASYGEPDEARPVIHCTAVSSGGTNRYALYTSARTNVTIRDLDIYAPDATSSILLKDPGSSSHQIINCALHGGGWGLRVFDTVGLLVHNTEIYDVDDDGAYLVQVTDLEVSHGFVHDVNQNWVPPYTPQADAAGDGLQLVSCNGWHVHHTVIDRTNSGNKFCFIASNPSQDDGLFEHNVLRGPLTTGDGGSSIYLHDGSGLIVRYNVIEGPSPSPLYSHATDLQIYGNVFTGPSGGVYASHSATLNNNVFHAMPEAMAGGQIVAHNNVFDLLSPSDQAFGATSGLEESHNLFATGTPTASSFGGDPSFVDAAGGNFRLAADSDGVDSGIDVGLGFDMDGVSIPQGAAPDVGAFELPQGQGE